MATRARAVRIVAIISAALLALVLGAIAIVSLLFDPNDYKAQLQSAFKDATGRDLQLDGKLSMSFFPWLAVETGAAAVANRPGFGDASFASLRGARLGVRLWPLIVSRRVELGPVEVEGLRLNLAVARDGRNNWSDLLDRLEERSAREPPPGAGTTSTEFSIARLDLEDASLRFNDAQAATRYAIDDWRLETSTLRKGVRFTVTTSLRAARNARALGAFELRTRVDPTQAGTLAFEETEGTLRLAREAAGALEIGLRVPRIALANATRNIAVDGLEARLGPTILRTSLTIQQSRGGPHASGTVEVERTDPRALLTALGVHPPRVRDTKVLRTFEAKSQLDYTAARGLRLDGLRLVLDDTHLQGRLGIADFSRLPIRFDLRGDALDADRYMPPPSAASKAAAEPVQSPPSAAEGGLRGWDVAGSLALGKLVAAGLPLSDVTMQVRLRNGQLALDPLRARAFGGRTETRLRYDLAAAEPTLRVDQTLSGVDVAAMLGQLIDVRQLEGRGNATFNLTTHGADGRALFANLQGPFQVEVTDGAWIGADLWFEIERAVGAAQLKQAAVASQSSGRTEFRRFAANGTLAERTLRSQHLEFVTDFADVQGRGKVDYGHDRLDLDLVARMLRTPPGRVLGVKLSRVKGADIPVHVGGALKSPQVRPDVSKLLEAAAKDAIKRPLDDELRKQLDKLFKF